MSVEREQPEEQQVLHSGVEGSVPARDARDPLPVEVVAREEQQMPQTGWFSFIPLTDGRVIAPEGILIATANLTPRQPLWVEATPENLEMAQSEEWMQTNTHFDKDERKKWQKKLRQAHKKVADKEARLEEKGYRTKRDEHYLEKIQEKERRLLGRVLLGSQLEEPMQGEARWIRRKAGITDEYMQQKREIVQGLYRNREDTTQELEEVLAKGGIIYDSLEEKTKRNLFGQYVKGKLADFEEQRAAYMGFAQGTFKVSGVHPEASTNEAQQVVVTFAEGRGNPYQWYKNKMLSNPRNVELSDRYANPLAACIGLITADAEPLLLLQWRAGAGEKLLKTVEYLETLIREGRTEELEDAKVNIQADLESLAVNKIYGDVLGPPGGIMDSKENPEVHGEGLIAPATTESVTGHAAWELSWEVGVSPEHTVVLVPIAMLMDERERHTEVVFYGESTLTFEQMVQQADEDVIRKRKNPNYAHEFAERTTGVRATPETIRDVLTKAGPLPTTHIGVVEGAGHMLMVKRLVQEEGMAYTLAVQMADTWQKNLDVDARAHYVEMDQSVVRLYAERPERLQALQILFPEMNPNGYDPHIPATLQGFLDPFKSLEEAEIPYARQSFLAASDEDLSSGMS